MTSHHLSPHEVYRIYEEYRTSFILDLSVIQQAVTSPDGLDELQIEQWLQEHCYYVIESHLIDDFRAKLDHNLHLAHSRQDESYRQHICHKLKIDVDPTTWAYIPNKVRIRLKIDGLTTGLTLDPSLCQLLQVPSDHIFQLRGQILHLFHLYIYQHQLQNQYDRKVLTPDDALTQWLTPLGSGEIEYTFYNLFTHLKGIVDHGSGSC
jgi:hypothetical protein|uniref:Uncharacterized protein n=1 Tax=viral metagenome TaxID=1070528 RepID=A0A6C0BJ83_9ZZZZ